MERELNGLLLKYEEGKIFVWREKRGNQTLKNPDWRLPRETFQFFFKLMRGNVLHVI